MAENFSNLEREMNIQVHEAKRIPKRLNLKRVTLNHIINKLSKIKDERNFEYIKRKATCYIWVHSHKTEYNSQQKLCRQGESGVTYSKYWKIKPVNQEFYTSPSCPEEMRDKNIPDQIKSDGVHCTRSALQNKQKYKDNN